MTIPPDLTPEQIDKYIREFEQTAAQGDNPRKLLAKGGQLSAIRDQLSTRLEKGWRWFQAHPDDLAAYDDFWLDLLSRYETINDLLAAHAGGVSRYIAARYTFDGVSDGSSLPSTARPS